MAGSEGRTPPSLSSPPRPRRRFPPSAGGGLLLGVAATAGTPAETAASSAAGGLRVAVLVAVSALLSLWVIKKLPDVRRQARRVRLQRACARAAGPVAVLDASGRFRIANDAFCSLLGRDAWHLLALTHHDVLHKLDATALPRRRRYLRPDGTTVEVLAAQRPVGAPDDGGRWTLLQLSKAPDGTTYLRPHDPAEARPDLRRADPAPDRPLTPARATTDGVRVTVTSFVDALPARRPRL